MKNRVVRFAGSLTLLGAIAVLVFGCKATGPRLSEPTPEYVSALAELGVELVEGGEVEQNALGGVIDLFSDFSHDPVAEKIHGVYAPTLFFRDGFKAFSSLDPLAEYMVESTKPLRSCRFEFAEPIRQGRDYYLRWTMTVSLNRDKPDYSEQVIGLSHLRFNAEGRVVFQQDYWDPTDVLYRRIPVAGWMIDKVKERL